MRIDLSADLGESPPGAEASGDAALLHSVTSVNVVCGVHAGDPTLIRRLLRGARDLGVRAGAHPGLPDRAGAGRRVLAIDPVEVEDAVLYQVAALAGLARAEGVALTHVKPHGALYHMATGDEAVAAAVVSATRLVDDRLAIVGLPGSALLEAARRAGLSIRAEAFADRAYEADGRLVPRGTPGAVLIDPDEVTARVVRLATEQRVRAVDGTDLAVAAGTICVHGDTPGAAGLARAVREALERAGIVVAAP